MSSPKPLLNLSNQTIHFVKSVLFVSSPFQRSRVTAASKIHMHCLPLSSYVWLSVYSSIINQPKVDITSSLNSSDNNNQSQPFAITITITILSDSCTRSRNINCTYASQELSQIGWGFTISTLAPRDTTVNTSSSPRTSSSTLQVGHSILQSL